jgi:hypothetical protein
MKKRELLICSFLFFTVLFPGQVIFAQKNMRSSDKYQPQWIQKTPEASNNSFQYIRAEGIAENAEDAEKRTLRNMFNKIPQTWKITVSDEVEITGGITVENGGRATGSTTTVYTAHVKQEGEEVQLQYRVVDHYWEQVKINGKIQYRSYVLYAVAKPKSVAYFDDVTTTSKYGVDALSRSIIPGWGQLYKGNKAKGISIIAGEALLVGGVVVCEGLRVDYAAKINETHDARKKQVYADKANNYATGRNICIGAAAALYVYNLIDAVAGEGQRRILVKKNAGFSLNPAVSPEYAGLSLAFRF